MNTKKLLFLSILLVANSGLNAYPIKLEQHGTLHANGIFEGYAGSDSYYRNHQTATDFYNQSIPCCKDFIDENCQKIQNTIYRFDDNWWEIRMCGNKLIDNPYFQEIIQKSERLQKYSENDQEAILTSIFEKLILLPTYCNGAHHYNMNDVKKAYLILASEDPNVSFQEIQLLELDSVLDNLENEIQQLEKERKEKAEQLVKIFEQKNKRAN